MVLKWIKLGLGWSSWVQTKEKACSSDLISLRSRWVFGHVGVIEHQQAWMVLLCASYICFGSLINLNVCNFMEELFDSSWDYILFIMDFMGFSKNGLGVSKLSKRKYLKFCVFSKYAVEVYLWRMRDKFSLKFIFFDVFLFLKSISLCL